MSRSFWQRAGAALVSVLVLGGCSVTRPKVPSDIAEALPTRFPTRTLTGFTAGLACMDRMFIDRRVEPVYVGIAPIPDFSESRGSAGYGTKEMLLSALSEMSRTSAAVRIVAYDQQTPDIIALQSAHPRKQSIRIPDFFIRGAITQIDTSPYSKQNGYSVNAGDIGKSLEGSGITDSASVSLASVSLDLNMGMVSTLQVLPGVSSTNTFSVEKRGDSTDYSLSFTKVGAIYNTGEQRAGALSRALRALVEVGAIELFGKLYNLPYWDCLAILGEDSPDHIAARERYADLNDAERRSYAATRLKAEGILAQDAVAISGERPSRAFLAAVSQYRARNGLFGNSVIDYPLFEHLFVAERQPPMPAAAPRRVGEAPPLPEPPPALPPAPAATTSAAPPGGMAR